MEEFNSAEIIYFFLSLLCETRRSTVASLLQYLQYTPAMKHTGFPHHTARVLSASPSLGKAIHPHNAAASKDISSFCKFFLGYFKDDFLSLLMIPTLNRLQSPLILFLLHPFCSKELLLSSLQNCLQMSSKNVVPKKSEKW